MRLAEALALLFFCLLAPGWLAAAVFLEGIRPKQALVLGPFLGLFTLPFLCFGAAILTGTVISARLLLGTALVVNALLALSLGVGRRRKRQGRPDRI